MLLKRGEQQMIRYFDYIKNLGVFNDYKKLPNCKKFERYNLIYGLNGSGKTTLSRFSGDLKTGNAKGFQNLRYRVTLENSISINEGKSFPINIQVFNSDYVESNIGSCEGELSPIYILGEDNKTLVAEIENDEKQLAELERILTETKNKIRDRNKEKDKIFTQIATEIKTKIADIKWSSYNRPKAVTAYAKLDRENRISNSEYDMALDSLSRQALELIAEVKGPEKTIDLKQVEISIQNICRESAISNAITDLLENPRLRSWTEIGMEIHMNTEFDYCEFCKQPFPEKRKQDLEQHFSDSDAALMQKIESLQNSLVEITTYLTDSLIYRSADYYLEFQKSSEEKQAQLNTIRRG